MIRIKKGFLLRKLGSKYVVIAVGEASRQFNGMIRLNETGAFCWQELDRGTTKQELARKLQENFGEPDEKIICRDMEEFLTSMRFALDYDNEQSN